MCDGGGNRAWNQPYQTVEHELQRAAVGSARTVEQFRRDKTGHADQERAQRRSNSLNVKNDIVHGTKHQRWHQTEKVGVLHRLCEYREQLAGFRQAWRMT